MATVPEKEPLPEPTIHEAELGGSSGAVIWEPEITIEVAADRRRKEKEIVVRGNNSRANRSRAREVEEKVGISKAEFPHASAGPRALPHFHQKSRSPSGHSFYETDNLRVCSKSLWGRFPTGRASCFSAARPVENRPGFVFFGRQAG